MERCPLTAGHFTRTEVDPIGCFPVVENDRLMGIVTETDILKQIAGG